MLGNGTDSCLMAGTYTCVCCYMYVSTTVCFVQLLVILTSYVSVEYCELLLSGGSRGVPRFPRKIPLKL